MYRYRIARRGVDDEIVPHPAALRHRAAFGVAAGGQFDVAAVDDGVVFDHRVLHPVVAVDGRVRHAVHHHQRAAEAPAGEAEKVVVAHGLARVDDADAAGVVGAVAEKDVAFHQIAVAVAQRQGAAGFQEQVAAEHVAAGFAGDDLHFAVAALEDVVLHHRARFDQRILAGADAQRFAAVGTEDGPVAEVVVIDAVFVLLACLGVQPHGHRHAAVAFAHQVRVVEAVVASVHHHPEVPLEALRVVEVIDHHLGHPRVVGEVFLGAPKRDDVARRRVTVREHQARDDEMLAAKAQVRAAGDEHLALGLGAQGDGPVRQALAGEDDLEIPPLAVGEHDGVPGPQVLQGIPIAGLVPDDVRGPVHKYRIRRGSGERAKKRYDKREPATRRRHHCAPFR